jgi:hypothetical protein
MKRKKEEKTNELAAALRLAFMSRKMWRVDSRKGETPQRL